MTAAAGAAPPRPSVALVEVTNDTLVARMPLLPGAHSRRWGLSLNPGRVVVTNDTLVLRMSLLPSEHSSRRWGFP